MRKVIAVRGKKEIVAIFNKYGILSGNQDSGRPQSAIDFVKFIAGLPMCEDTKKELRASSKLKIDVSHIKDGSIPTFIKIPIEIDEEEWDKAMEVFKYVFELKGAPQMPYFIKVAGMACIKRLESQNVELGVAVKEQAEEVKIAMKIETFAKLSAEEKLIEIYRLLIESLLIKNQALSEKSL